MAVKKALQKAIKTQRQTKSEKAAQQRVESGIAQAARAAGIPPVQVQALQSAKIDYYLLIDFGFTANQPFVPNSIQFYSNAGFLCSKVVD
ncbi:MAG TPA: hypothetical protein VJZ00_04490, partial [Thermoanaerobaculia bacterium]|nr:hypothetical protein [Thermoanaerobaculia bacterium]